MKNKKWTMNNEHSKNIWTRSNILIGMKMFKIIIMFNWSKAKCIAPLPHKKSPHWLYWWVKNTHYVSEWHVCRSILVYLSRACSFQFYVRGWCSKNSWASDEPKIWSLIIFIVFLYAKGSRKNIKTHHRVIFMPWEFFEHADSFFRKVKIDGKVLT